MKFTIVSVGLLLASAAMYVSTYAGVFSIAAVLGWARLIGDTRRQLHWRRLVSTILLSGSTGVMFALAYRMTARWAHAPDATWVEPIFEQCLLAIIAGVSEVQISEIGARIMKAFGIQWIDDHE